ncbi:Predicted membrane protein [Raoultella planticola]|uniref:Predicted membrane protein n=1 Tax=Raoultella planticola TaxID=575 RepID=A0A485AG66_RAOPL|nr:Predicted membrane protein [Raoultella planticola]
MMLMGAALMRSGWLKGQFSLSHYRRTGALLIVAGMVVNLPAIFAQWHLGGILAGVRSCYRLLASWGRRCRQ